MTFKPTLLGLVLGLSSIALCRGADVEIKLQATPEPVQTALKKCAGSSKVLRVEKAEEEGKTQYEILTSNDAGKKVEYIFQANGSLAGTEEILTMDELPAGVKTTAMETVGKGKVKSIEKITEDGKVTYEVGYKSDKGEKREAVVSAKGKLLKNSAETD